MSVDEASREFRIGDKGQRLVESILQQAGWKTIASYAYTGGAKIKAPHLAGLQGCLVIPDLDICRAGQRRWVEVKTKCKPVPFRRWGWRLIHGISLAHYLAYRKVEAEMGTPVWLFVYEYSWNWNNIVCAPLDELESKSRIYQGENEQDQGGNIYFERGAFRLFAIPQGELWEMRDGRWILPKRSD